MADDIIDFKPDMPPPGGTIDFQPSAAASMQPAGWQQTLNRAAAAPGEMLGQIPYVGGALQSMTPSTPGQWAGTITGAALAPLGPLAAAGGAGMGALVGSAMGGASSGQAAGDVIGSAAGQYIGQKFIGPAINWATKQVKGYFTPVIKDLGDKIAQFVPTTGERNGTWLHNLIRGGEGEEALSAQYRAGMQAVKDIAGPDAFVQNPRMTEIIDEFKNFLPTAKRLGTPAGTRGQPAGLVYQRTSGGGDAISLDQALQINRELQAKARNISPKDKIAPLIREAANEFRNLLADALPPNARLQMQWTNLQYGRGINLIDVLKDKADDIFISSSGKYPKIDEAGLADAFNSAQGLVNKWQLGEVQKAAIRGGLPGTGATRTQLPSISTYLTPVFGHIRAHRTIGFTNYPGAEVGAAPAIGGYAGQQLGTSETFGDLLNQAR